MKAGSHSPNSAIAMPVKFFKTIFEENPKINKEYEVPKGVEHFIVKVIVKKVKVIVKKVKANDKDSGS